MLIHCTADAEKDADMKRLKSEEAITILKDMKVDIPVPKAAVTQIKRNAAIEMAIDALKAQADGDTISRKAAIEEIARWIGYIDEDMILRIQTGLKKLQSAQSEPCGDAVSRNAIIQKLNTMDRYVSEEPILCDTDKKFPKNEVFIVDDVYEEIVEQLPPAQPDLSEYSDKLWKAAYERGKAEALDEIVRCKDCKHWKDSDGVYRRGIGAESKCPVNIRAVYEGNFYCADAERRTDGSD